MMYPGLASWAKFSRPCGTEFGNGVLTHALQDLKSAFHFISREPGRLLDVLSADWRLLIHVVLFLHLLMEAPGSLTAIQ